MTRRTLVLLLLLATTALAAGWWWNRPEQPSQTTSPRGTETIPALKAINDAEKIGDPLKRCMEYPAPSGYDWPRETTDALCIDAFTPRLERHKLLAWIQEGKAEELDRYFDDLVAGFEAGRVPEGVFWLSYVRKFQLTGTDATAHLDFWLKQRPTSPHAHAAMALHRTANAWGFRGSNFYSDMEQQDIDNMHREVELAVAAAKTAIELDPRILPAYGVLIQLGPLGAGDEVADQAARDALKVRPDSYYIRDRMMRTAQPKWGGSQRELEAIATEGMQHVDKNPRLRLLQVDAAGYRGHDAHRDDHNREAAAQFEKALAFGPHWEYLGMAELAMRESGNPLRAVEFQSQVLRYGPGDVSTRVARATLLADLIEVEWAAEFDQMIAQAGNSDTSLIKSYAWLLTKHGRAVDAATHLQGLLIATPKDEWVLRKLAEFYLYQQPNFEKALPLIDQLLALDPNDGASLLLKLDYLSMSNSGDFTEVAKRFAKYGDESHSVQRAALPKVRAWLVSAGEIEAAAARNQSIPYEIYELPAAAVPVLLADGMKLYDVSEVRVEERHETGRHYWGKSVHIWDEFSIGASVFRERAFEEFALWIERKGLPGEWQWFERESEDTFVARDEVARVRVTVEKESAWNELTSVEFLSDLTLRGRFSSGEGDTHRMVVKKGGILRVAP